MQKVCTKCTHFFCWNNVFFITLCKILYNVQSMKKILSIIVCLFTITFTCYAQGEYGTQIAFTVGYINPSSTANQNPRSPIAPPTVYLEDNPLSFVPDHPEYVLYIKDEDEEVVYSSVVTSAETQVTLPTYLTGSYKIELVMGNWCFWGYITL